jgi:hypothetical protein
MTTRYYGFAESKKGLVKIEEGKPLTFFVLADDYSSKGIWVHPVGVHFIKGTQIACSEEEKVPAPCFTCERIREMRVGGSEIFPYLGPLKYAMNVLIKGEETPRVFLAPTRVGEDIIQDFDDGIKNDIKRFIDLDDRASREQI